MVINFAKNEFYNTNQEIMIRYDDIPVDFGDDWIEKVVNEAVNIINISVNYSDEDDVISHEIRMKILNLHNIYRITATDMIGILRNSIIDHNVNAD